MTDAPEHDEPVEQPDEIEQSVEDDASAAEEAVADVDADADSEPDVPEPVDSGADAEPASEEEASLDEMVAELVDSDEAADSADADTESEGESDGEPAIAALLASDHIGARWPFWAYLGVWAVFVGAMTYLLWAASAGPFLDHPLYQILVFGGAGLTVAGPLLGLVVFFIIRGRSEGESRTGLLRTTLLRTATWTVLGVAVWCLALAALELHRAKMLG